MNRRQTTRRGFLGTMVGGAALLGVGQVPGVRADMARPGHGDKATFKSSCNQHGGVFVDSPRDKLTICVWSDGSKTVCDANGNDCINYPPPPKKAPGGQFPVGGFTPAELAALSEFVPAEVAFTEVPAFVKAKSGIVIESAGHRRNEKSPRRKSRSKN